MNSRIETRRERYDKKFKDAKKYPISLCAINFRVDDNLGYLIRSAACFGAERLYVIGHVPERSSIKASRQDRLVDYVEIVQVLYDRRNFLSHACRTGREFRLLLASWLEKARIILLLIVSIFVATLAWLLVTKRLEFPAEILSRSDVIHIPMPGVGYCLNTSQAANIMLYEAVRQYDNYMSEKYV